MIHAHKIAHIFWRFIRLTLIMINAKDIARKLKGEELPKVSKNLYLNKTIVKTFEKDCEALDLKPSNVVEELMNAFSESLRDSKPKPIKSKKAAVKKN